ncbi:S-layer homology domain-containing protein [Sporobacter termitidis DSM 10068]|uniref:S-layer homology domain-containing protein n=1 Tax=Sporobacter termitidis DSM 10068 TaxID=1123282 RepID=A0A1M5YEY7_9FIRM|nr:S-layer homology domain-containing protein [Sporobacter termitidis]SHI10093.1 S-layer homology domain-containing protein [Sporobacter termitidis DSM 10068]
MVLKKGIAVLIAVLLLSASAVYAKAAAIGDLDKTSGYARAYVEDLAEKGILTGDESGNINPQRTITRGEAAALLVRTLGSLGIRAGSLPAAATFKDVPMGSWAFPYVETAYMAGLVKGVSQDEFDLNAPCTREQMAALFVRAFDASGQFEDLSVTIRDVSELSDGAEISAWAKDSVLLALKSGLMKGTPNNTFSPLASAPKEQAAAVIDRFLGKVIQSPAKASVPISTDTGGPAVVFNGDVMALSHAPLVENGAVLLPADFFYRYFGPAESGAAVTDSGTTCLALRWGYNHLSSGYGNFYNTLWFKAGEKTAYKSGFVQQSPFEDPEAYAANALPLQTAPVVNNGVLYLPLEDICAITETPYDNDPAANTVTVTTDALAEYPQLRAALYDDANVNLSRVPREVVANGTFTQSISGGDPQPDAQINLVYSLDKQANGVASQTDLECALQQGGAARNLIYKRISAPLLSVDAVTDTMPSVTVTSINDPIPADWLNSQRQYLSDVSALTGLDPIGTGKKVGSGTVSQKLVSNYNNLPIERLGMVSLNGQQAAEYAIRLDGDDIMQVYGRTTADSNLFSAAFSKGYTYEIDLYVVGNTLVRQEYHFSGQNQESSASLAKVTMDLTVDYQNLGKIPSITLPNGIVVQPGA